MNFRITDVFATQSCGRCGGSGRYSFNLMDGDRCYGCNGSGRNWTRKDRPFAEDFTRALREYTRSTFRNIRPDDVFCHPDDMNHPFRGESRPKAGARFLRAEAVTNIEGTPESYSSRAGYGAEPNTVWTYHGWVEVTVTGGEVLKLSHACYLYRRCYLDRVLDLCKNPKTVERVRDYLRIEEAKAAYAGREEGTEAPEAVAQLTVRMAVKKLSFGEAQAAVEAVARQLKQTARLGAIWSELPEFVRAAMAAATPVQTPRARQRRRKVVSDECVVCDKPVFEGEDESTYCGTVHEGCLEEHKMACRVCDVDGEYHSDEDVDGDGNEAEAA